MFNNLFGVECWGCGLTRAFSNFFNFNFSQAFNYNKGVIVIIPLMAFLWLHFIYYYIKKYFLK
ncbi:DUF2752 domain-containing protein [Proteinivorax tanatarense]|uniref:DUF2752 domain-containing protein n=1 Tax=Proteinivorax tanatarense TaxID=1260629 RepID=UPI003313DA9D